MYFQLKLLHRLSKALYIQILHICGCHWFICWLLPLNQSGLDRYELRQYRQRLVLLACSRQRRRWWKNGCGLPATRLDIWLHHRKLRWRLVSRVDLWYGIAQKVVIAHGQCCAAVILRRRRWLRLLGFHAFCHVSLFVDIQLNNFQIGIILFLIDKLGRVLLACWFCLFFFSFFACRLDYESIRLIFKFLFLCREDGLKILQSGVPANAPSVSARNNLIVSFVMLTRFILLHVPGGKHLFVRFLLLAV